jgi:FlaG/FlaF family flagellin (archaellin)
VSVRPPYTDRDARAVSPVVGVLLLVALTTLLAATVGAFTLGLTTPTGTPSVATSTGPLVAYDHADGDREQRIRLVHEGGPAVNVSALELVVTVERTGEQVRVFGLPVRSNKLDRTNVAGGGFLDASHGETVGALSTAPPDTDGVWSAGDVLGVRLTSSDVRLAPGEQVTVRLVHALSGGVVAAEALTAR